MMSVLVYIGIRILISSTASEKAKYKQLIGDWVIGMLLLFTMHFIMIFSNVAVDKLTALFTSINPMGQTAIIEDPNNKVETELKAYEIDTVREVTDIKLKDKNTLSSSNRIVYKYKDKDDKEYIEWNTDLMGKLRIELQAHKNKKESYIGYTIMFITMAIFTGTFCFVYIRRVVYMAFLTIIAPLVALTYPIDKVNDGSAQGFNYWFKEYIFNLLLQPLHLLVYTILVSSAIVLAAQNVIYALVALGFVVSAEKILRQMFNFSKASTPGVFAGPAGAALTMAGIRWLFGHGPNGQKGSGGSGKSDKSLDKGNDGNYSTDSSKRLTMSNLLADKLGIGAGGDTGGSDASGPLTGKRAGAGTGPDLGDIGGAGAGSGAGAGGTGAGKKFGTSRKTGTGTGTGAGGGTGSGAKKIARKIYRPNYKKVWIGNNKKDQSRLLNKTPLKRFNKSQAERYMDQIAKKSRIKRDAYRQRVLPKPNIKGIKKGSEFIGPAGKKFTPYKYKKDPLNPVKETLSYYGAGMKSKIGHAINDAKPLEAAGRLGAKAIVGTTLGIAAAGAGVAAGDASKTAQFTAAAVAGGGKLGGGVYNSVADALHVEGIEDEFERAQLGEAEYQKKLAEQNQKNFIESEEHIKRIREKQKISRSAAEEYLQDDFVKTCLENKITDIDEIMDLKSILDGREKRTHIEQVPTGKQRKNNETGEMENIYEDQVVDDGEWTEDDLIAAYTSNKTFFGGSTNTNKETMDKMEVTWSNKEYAGYAEPKRMAKETRYRVEGLQRSLNKVRKGV